MKRELESIKKMWNGPYADERHTITEVYKRMQKFLIDVSPDCYGKLGGTASLFTAATADGDVDKGGTASLFNTAGWGCFLVYVSGTGSTARCWRATRRLKAR
eukprot:COSAG05_NODE_789_length_7324_cov_4.272664_2_plen_102_part_00